jgi:phosphate transport system substrate-binding protein
MNIHSYKNCFIQTFALSALILLVLLPLGCSDAGTRGTDRLIITGSSTLAPLIADIARQYEQQKPHIRVDVQTGGSSRGISDTQSGLADIGMSSRDLADDETSLTATPIAIDGIAVILHRENRVTELSDTKTRNIYTGVITNWREVGGRYAEIVVVNKAAGRATREVFLNHFSLQPLDVRADVIIGDNEQGVKTVAGNVNAIGYVSIGTADYDANNGVPIKLLPSNHVPASTASVAEGVYPIVRPLNLVTTGPPTGLTADFIAYARSQAVTEIYDRHYFVQTNQN